MFDCASQENFKDRMKKGFRPSRTGRASDAVGETGNKNGLWAKIQSLIDPTVTPVMLINEGIIYAALAFW